jgi:hypothetical protein
MIKYKAMNRRRALANISFYVGTGIALPSYLLTNCQSDTYKPIFFETNDIPLLDEIGETIIPNTLDSPGAKESKIGNFIDIYVAHCYSSENQDKLRKGITEFQEECKEKMGESFLRLPPARRHQFLVELDQTSNTTPSEADIHYFKLLKNLVLFGYFTSREGATQALRYLPIPGKFIGNYSFKTGDKAWAL